MTNLEYIVQNCLMYGTTSDECWEWPFYRNTSGHGQLTIKRKRHYAHRVSYEIVFGEIPSGLYVCHTCDNPPCFNPNHLFTGTQFDNMRDASSKGRIRGQKKESCPKGHPYDEENTYINPMGRRECRQCRQERRAAWRAA